MHVHALYHYPVKSLGGASPRELVPEQRGFRDDRRWMLVDAAGRFLTQRLNRQLTHFGARASGADVLEVYRVADGQRVLAIERARPTGPPTAEVTVWDDTFLAHEVPLPAGDLKRLRTELDIADLRLVYLGSGVERPVKTGYARHGEQASFADGYPYLITTTASLADLSTRYGAPLDVRRFRPNIVLAADAPFVEDDWTDLRIGGHRFYVAKPCARCVVVTLDPDRGTRDARVMKTLSAYRRTPEGKVLFGVNAYWAGGEGLVRVGDEVVLGAGVE